MIYSGSRQNHTILLGAMQATFIDKNVSSLQFDPFRLIIADLVKPRVAEFSALA
jgi:hypothetical protein